jgi:hypothetical protein
MDIEDPAKAHKPHKESKEYITKAFIQTGFNHAPAGGTPGSEVSIILAVFNA